MRTLLFAAAAAAPLLAYAASAAGQTTVSSGSTTPLATSSAGDVTVASGGAITLNSSTPGITLDSDNAVTVVGAVTGTDVNTATGVLLQGGHTGSLTTTGAITVSESYTASDSINSDSVVEAPFASGTGRYGVRLTGSTPLTGAISLSGPVVVKGNSSYGVSLEAPLAGPLGVTGGVALTGDAGVALQELGGVTGAVTLSAVSASGQGSRAVLLSGDIGGAARFQGAVTATGYSTTTRLADAAQAKLQATPTDVEQGGAAVTVAANVAGGVYFSAPPASTVSGSTADLDGDGVADGSETTAAITQFGSAPAVLIGASGKAITLGDFGTGDNAFGLLIRGSVTASGLEDGVSAAALQLGTGDGSVSLGDGIRIVGTVAAASYEANATAMHLLSGVGVAQLRNEGTISAVVNDSTLTTSPATATATALLVEPGASLPSLFNSGAISATAAGGAMTTRAILDGSGSLSALVNEGTIKAVATPLSASDALTGRQIALDLSRNTTGVTLVQQANPVTSVAYGSTSGSDATATTAVTPAAPSITGDILLGSGPNTVQILAGAVSGALDLGSGAGSSLTLDNGATYTGALTYAGPSLALNVNNGVLTDLGTSRLNLSSLAIGASGQLAVTVDPAHAAATQLVASGPATLASGARIAVRLVSAPTTATGAQTFALISSPQLSVAGGTSSLATATSYLFSTSFAVDATGTTLDLTVARRSAADLGLTTSEGAGLDAVLTGVSRSPDLLQALLAPTAKSGFSHVYDQLLPDHAGGVFLAAQQASETVGRAATEPRATSGPGAWTQEFVLGVQSDRQTATAAHAGGFGFAGGLESDASGLGVLGVSAAFYDASVTDPDIDTDSRTNFFGLEGGLYWRASLGGLKLSARGAGGYLYGDDRRAISIAATDGVPAQAFATKGTWHGWTADASAGAAYQLDIGPLFLRPGLSVEYFRLNQDGYTEREGGDAVDLAVSARSGDAAFGTASVTLGARFGEGVVWRPSLELGARDVFTGDAGVTTARFAAGGDSFSLTPNPITGVGALAKAALKISSSSYEITVDADGQDYAKYREGAVRAGVSFVF